MKPVLRRFDLRGLYSALDAERSARGLTWVALAVEINRVFEGTSSIPISVATIRGIPTKRSVTSAVVLQALAWLRRTPESFLIGNTSPERPEETLPGIGPSRILRLDTRALHAALDARRRQRGLTWRQIAGDLPGFTDTMLRNLANGPLIGFPRVMFITQWLELPASSFVRVRGL